MDAVSAVRELVTVAIELGRAATGALELVPRLVAALDQVDRLLLHADAAHSRWRAWPATPTA